MDPSSALPDSFESLAASRRQWIEQVLRPWCQSAELKQLRKAEAEWLDIAGRVDVNATLWTWAWERFAPLTHPDLSGVNETHTVKVELHDGTVVEGFPDARRSVRGTLVLVWRDAATGRAESSKPLTIDDVCSVRLAE